MPGRKESSMGGNHMPFTGASVNGRRGSKARTSTTGVATKAAPPAPAKRQSRPASLDEVRRDVYGDTSYAGTGGGRFRRLW